jgi:hypothetical protein
VPERVRHHPGDQPAYLVHRQQEPVVPATGRDDVQRPEAGRQVGGEVLLQGQGREQVGVDATDQDGARASCSARRAPPRPHPTSQVFIESVSVT